MRTSLSQSNLQSHSGHSDGLDCSFHFTKEHTTDAFRSMNNMRLCGDMCDVTLAIGERCIPAHKIVLAATSPYFHAMFTNEMVEKSSSEVQMHEIDPSALELLVEYTYTSQIIISENNVQVLLPAACQLQITSVRDACCKFLMKQLHPANCLGIRRFADTHACEDLLVQSHQFALSNFLDVCDTEEFLLLNVKDLNHLLLSEEINVEKEEEIYTSVIKWLQYDINKRKQHAAQLLSKIRMPLMSREFLMNTVEAEDIIQTEEACKDLLIEAMKYHLMPEKRNQLQSIRTKERRSKAFRPMLFAVGGGSLFAVHNECEYYDQGCDQWIPVAPMTSRRSRCGVAVVHGKLYAIGGYDGSQDLSSAECYNPRVNKWSRITSMGTKRSCLGTCEWNGLLYVIGGYDGASCLSSVERYDPLTLTWTSVAAMNLRRRYLRIAVLDGCIYAIGGYDGSSHMSSVERFDPEVNKWIAGPNMISRRSNCGVAVLDGMIYVCGGSDGATCLSSVERFNTKRNLWEAVSPMHSRRSTHDVVVLDGCIYAIGGNDGSTSLNSMERYNPKANKWVLVAPMNMRRSSVAAAVLDMAKHKPGWTPDNCQ